MDSRTKILKLYILLCFKVALVRWTEEVGLGLTKRDNNSIQLRTPITTFIDFTILQIFPFTSESKRMGIIVKVLA